MTMDGSKRTAGLSDKRILVMVSDEELTSLARAGDSQAEEYLIRKYKDTAIAKTQPYFIIGADRDDLIQEGMIGLLKAVRGFDPERGSAFRTFAEICIDRQLKTAIKQAGRLKHNPLNTSLSLDLPSTGSEGTDQLVDCLPEQNVSNPEELLILKEAMADLSGAEPLLSRFEAQVWGLLIDGRSATEIASAVQKSPKSIDNAFQRIKRKIRQVYR